MVKTKVYAQTHQLTLGASLAIREANRLKDIRLYAEYLSPSLIRWLQDERWPLQAICGVDPYHYGRLVLRAAYARSSDNDRRVSIAPVLITREMVRKPGGLTHMIEIPKLFPETDVRLDDLDRPTQEVLSRDAWYRKHRDRIDMSRERSSQ